MGYNSPYYQDREQRRGFSQVREVIEVNNSNEANEYLKKGYRLIYLSTLNKGKDRVMVYVLGKT